MKVYVYFNLHKKVWSIKALEGPNKGRVIAHQPSITLTDVQFKVGKAGRLRVLREYRKNVHAGVVGYVGEVGDVPKAAQVVRYNPYLRGEFFDEEGQPVHSAKSVKLTADRKVWAW